MRQSIGGQLTVEALAHLHAPRTSEELRVACYEMASRRMPVYTIARPTGLSGAAGAAGGGVMRKRCSGWARRYLRRKRRQL